MTANTWNKMGCLYPHSPSSSLFSLTPSEKNNDNTLEQSANLSSIHNLLRSYLQTKVSGSKHGDWMPPISPTAMNIPLQETDEMIKLQQALHQGITIILKLWFSNHPLVCSTLTLPRKLERALRAQVGSTLSISKNDYKLTTILSSIGCYRPDIIYDEHGTMKVCEVNARFTVNGYFLSVFLAEAAQQGIFQPLLTNNDDIDHTSTFSPTISPIPSTLAFPRSLANKIRSSVSPVISNKDDEVIVYCVRGREPGHDLDWLVTILNDFRITVKYGMKSELTAKDDKLFIDKNEVFFCVLELHQDELLDLSDEVLDALMSLSLKGRCLNPLWSICLVHDKRLLSLLTSLSTLITNKGESDSDNVFQSVTVDDSVLSILKRHVIPTMVMGLDDMKSILNNPLETSMIDRLLGTSLVVKPALLGKGEGIVLQKNFTSNHAFLEAIEKEYSSIEHLLYQQETIVNSSSTSIDDCNEESHKNTVSTKPKQLIVQPFIDNQKRFKLADEPMLNTDGHQSSSLVSNQEWHCVGTLLCMDDMFFGPGIFRFSSQDLIALTRGGIAVTPIHVLSHVPVVCVNRVQSMENIFVGNDVRKRLIQDGMAILSCDSSFHTANVSLDAALKSFLEDEWHASLKEPAIGKGAVWSISPMNQGIARSHQSEEFDTHTDASYEINPPRYFALAVKACDKKGGGRSGFARIRDVIEQLSNEEFDILRTTIVRWDVPIEFRKSKTLDDNTFPEEFIMAPVLMSRERARVRPDIMKMDHLPINEKNRFQKAFHHFYQLLQHACDKSTCLLPEGTVLFLDNQRFVHCRSAIKDMSRHLIRIRFDLEESPEVESICRLQCENMEGLWTTRLIDCPIMKKGDLLNKIHRTFTEQKSDWFHGKEGIYWSPSGGSTSSSTLTTEQCAVPSLLSENDTMRLRLRDQLRQFGAFSKHSVVLNLMACGNLYRSLEIFHEIVVSAGGTDLPLGADASEESIFQFIKHFKVNTICGWPSKLMKLITYAKDQAKHTCSQQKSDDDLLGLLKGIKTIVHGGELLNQAKHDLLLSTCNDDCKLFGVFGSAEVGIFATTNGNPFEDDLYYIVPDTVHIELLRDEDVNESENNLSSGIKKYHSISFNDDQQEGTIVATNLIRKAIQPILRFWMDDRAYWYHRPCSQHGDNCSCRCYGSNGQQQIIRLTGRSGVSIAFPLGPIFLRWSDIQTDVIGKFEEAFPSALVIGQAWFCCGKIPGKDCLYIRIFIESPVGADERRDRDIVNDIATLSLGRLKDLVKDVPNLECIAIQRVANINDLALNKRSNKQLYFVENRNSQYGQECKILDCWSAYTSGGE